MTKAEEQALKAYPRATRDIGGMVVDIGHPQYMRDLYIEGYNQAEKDLELTWQDIRRILDAADKLAIDYGSEKLNEIGYDDYCKEVLARYMETKKD